MYTPIIFSLTALEQVGVFAALLVLSAVSFRADTLEVAMSGLWISVFWIGMVFFSGFKTSVSLWAPFIMLPYFLLAYAIYWVIILILNQWKKPLTGDAGMVMLGLPMMFVPFAIFYFPVHLVVFVWRTIFN